MLFHVILTIALSFCIAIDEFENFSQIIQEKYLREVRAQIGRQGDPCRAAVAGRSGTLPNSASELLAKLRIMSDKAKIHSSRVDPEIAATRCKEALQLNTKDKALNREICAEALAHYRHNLAEKNLGRSSSSAWDELFGDLSEALTTEQILEGLDFFLPKSLAFLIDSTGSMSGDIDQVSMIVEDFVRNSQDQESMIYYFVIMSFGDPDYQEPTSYQEATHAVKHLNNNIVTSMGGDCPEMTCQAVEALLLYSGVSGPSPIYIFTDASSKDCDEDLMFELIDIARSFQHTLNFVLTGTCDDGEVDGNYTQLAAETGGNIYRLKDYEIYNLTEIIKGSVQSSIGEIPFYDEESGVREGNTYREKRSSHSYLNLDRQRRRIIYEEVALYVDETVGKLTIQVTFVNPADLRVLDAVSLIAKGNLRSKENGRSFGEECTEATGQKFGNTVHYAVNCPCVGEWRLKVPSSITNRFSYSAKTFGEFSIAFDAMFEHQPASAFDERTKQPCVGEKTTIWISTSQEDSITGDSITMILSESYSNSKNYLLSRSNNLKGFWSTTLRIPKFPFSIAIRGTTIEGNPFLRIHHTQIKPTTTCLKTVRIAPSINSIKAGGQTNIIISLKNKDTPKTYTINCFNDRRKDGFKTKITRPTYKHYGEVSKVTTEVNRSYYIYIQVRAPPVVGVGEVVKVKCLASSDDSDPVYKKYNLMVTSVYA